MQLSLSHVRRSLAPALAALSVVMAACGGGASSDSTQGASSPNRESASAGLRVVAVGDSETSGEGDPTGVGWVVRYARLLRTELGLRVQVSNLARSAKTSDELLADLRSDADVRTPRANS